MTRRAKPIAAICGAALTLAAATTTRTAAAEATTTRPNLVIFFTDDQGYNDVGCFGSPQIKTPTFDRMATEGIRFTNFHAQPVCGPSRAALMTGCYPIRVAEPDNGKHQHNVLHPKEVTIAEVLKGAGYDTALIGKWHLAGGRQDDYPPELMPNAQGFDYFYGTPLHNGYTREVSHGSFKAQLARNGEILKQAMTQDDMNNLTGNYTREAVRFIREHTSRPFFLYLAHNMPHVPLGASDAFRGKSPRGLYGDVIQELDWSLAQVLQTLKTEGLDERTLILFTSDNGPWIEKQIGDYAGCADPLRGWKMSAWEGGSRVPCIVRWPGAVPAGRVCDGLATTMDLLPTFAALAGAALPADRTLDGQDISSYLLGHGPLPDNRTYYVYNWVRLTGVIHDTWKLVLPREACPKGTGWSGRLIDAVPQTQLYNLKTDIGERHDVAAQHPEVVDQLMPLVEHAREELGDYDRVGRGCRFFDGPAPSAWSERGQAGTPRAAPPTSAPFPPVGNLRFTFENGATNGWRTRDGTAAHLVTELHPLYQHGEDGREGKGLMTTLSRTRQWDGGDSETAVIESPAFRVQGTKLAFLLGGGQHELTYLALVDATDGRVLRREHGPGGPRMKRVVWDLSAETNRIVRLRLVDQRDGGPWGHLTLDDVSVQGEVVSGVETPYTRAPTPPRVSFVFQNVAGIGHEAGVCRRDPSDVIRVDNTYYVWYSKVTRAGKLYPSGYNATVWYAVSTDEGHAWREAGQAVGLSNEGFDSFGVFTPNILVADGKYYLFYTAVAKGFVNSGYSDAGRTAIGLAIADSPEGPWQRYAGNPVLTSTRDPASFDSFRVDDTCFVVRDGKYWMYYKGRQWQNTPGHTKMGVAVAQKPEGPYVRLNGGRCVQDSGHEVMVWPAGHGVMSLVSATGPQGRTIQYADDGLDFRVLCPLTNYPAAPGAFRADLTEPAAPRNGITWGIGMSGGTDPFLVRYECIGLPEVVP